MKDLFDIYAIQKDSGKLHSLLLELEEVEQWQKELQYRKGVPEQPTESEWYKEEKKRLECEITWYESKVQEDRKALDFFLTTIPYPANEIIRYRVVNHLSWKEIGAMFYLDRRTVARKFKEYVKEKLNKTESISKNLTKPKKDL